MGTDNIFMRVSEATFCIKKAVYDANLCVMFEEDDLHMSVCKQYSITGRSQKRMI